jgi:hypothetical protein
MWRAITLIMLFLAGLIPIGLIGCASSGYPPTVHYGVNVGYGSYWRNDHRHDHYHHYRPRPRPPHRPDRPNRPNRPNRPRPRPSQRPSRR